MPDPISGNRRVPTNINVNDLQGQEIAQGAEKVAETASTRIELSTEIQPGFYVPDLKMTTRNIEDPQAKDTILSVTPDEVAGLDSPEAFKDFLNSKLEENKSFLFPNREELADAVGEKTNFAYNHISGKRIEQFFQEALSVADSTGLQGADLSAARKEVNIAHADAYRNREIRFDKSDTGTYWSYGHDAAFVHVYEKMLNSLPEGHDARENLQKQIDYIFEKKYVPGGKMDENNAEKTMGLVAIDAESRNAISMNPETMNTPAPTYDTIQVDPNVAGEHAGKQVVWDNKADAYYFQGTKEEIPAELKDSLVRTPVNDVTFRRAGDNESLREGFKYDWNGNRMIDHEKHDTSWWGHCDIKAVMETVHTDMKNAGSVHEYRSDSGKTTEFTRSDMLEALSSRLNMGGGYVELGSGKQVGLGEREFGGARNDDRDDKAYMLVNGKYMDFDINIKTMSKPNEFDESVNIKETFQEFTTDNARESFTENEAFAQKIEGDTHIISGADRKITGNTEFYTVNENGQWVKDQSNFTIDPSVNNGDKVLLGTQIQDINNHKLQRFYYDPNTKEVSVADVRFQNENGKFEAVESDARVLGESQNLLLAREMQSGDDVEGKARVFNSALRSGVAIATDSDKGSQVWNGAVYNLRENVVWRSDDGKFERVEMHVDAVFGKGKVGTKLNELDDEGRVVRSHETNAPVDFFWRDVPRVAPIVHENGKWYINSEMHNRGLVDLQDINTSLAAGRDLNDLLYLGLNSKDKKDMYTIVHDGKRLVYNDKAAWEADVQKLEDAANQ